MLIVAVYGVHFGCQVDAVFVNMINDKAMAGKLAVELLHLSVLQHKVVAFALCLNNISHRLVGCGRHVGNCSC